MDVNKNYRVIGVCPPPAAGAANITTRSTAEFGAPAQGQKVFVRVHLLVDGYQSVPAVFNAIVPPAASPTLIAPVFLRSGSAPLPEQYRTATVTLR